MSTMTMTGNTGREPPGGKPTDPTVVIHTTHVRFAIAQKDASNTVPIPSIMHKIMNKLRDHDNKATFNDIENKIISMEAFPVDKDKFDKAFGTIIPKGRNPQVLVGLTINSALLFGAIKTALLPVLRNQRVYMRPHLSTSWKSLDAIPIAHLHEIHPTFADFTQVKANLIAMLEKAIEKVKNDDEFHKIIGDNAPDIPEIMLYTGRVQGKLGDQEINSEVIEVYVARENAQLTKFLFEASSSLSARNLEIVPREFKFNHPTIYGQILNKQNAYLSKHRNIAIVAIPVHAMYHAITDQNGKTWKTLKDAILAVDGVTHVHACKRTHDLGKWNISTNETSWENVKIWLDTHLNKLYRHIPVATRNRYQDYPDFEKPERLHANRTTNRSNTNNHQDKYAAQLQKSILGTDIITIPTRAIAPAWKSTPRLVYTLDDMQGFPTLSKSADDRSTGSLATTTSLSASADETIRHLEKQWKIDKECFTTNLESAIDIKLAAMDTKIENVLSSLQKTVEHAMQTSMANFETKITNMVSGLLAAQSGAIITQVATSMSGANSPFVTAESLHRVMEKFIDSVNTRIDTLANTPPYTINENGSPVRKQSRTNASDEYATPMDTQPSQDDDTINAATQRVDGENH
jgi:hypothetical protein